MIQFWLIMILWLWINTPFRVRFLANNVYNIYNGYVTIIIMNRCIVMMITNMYIVCSDRSIYWVINNQFKNYRFKNVILNMSWLGISFWIGISMVKSLGLANTSCRVLSSINLYGFSLLMLTRIGLKLNLSMVTSKIVSLGKQYCIL